MDHLFLHFYFLSFLRSNSSIKNTKHRRSRIKHLPMIFDVYIYIYIYIYMYRSIYRSIYLFIYLSIDNPSVALIPLHFHFQVGSNRVVSCPIWVHQHFRVDQNQVECTSKLSVTKSGLDPCRVGPVFKKH